MTDDQVYFDAVPVPPDGYVPGELIAAPFLDPIRKTALECAVQWTRGVNIPGEDVLDVARRFERYLTGEEAND